MKLALNFLLFQFAWFTSVLGAANDMPAAGPAAVAMVVAVHLMLAARPNLELMLVAVCGAFGAVFDSILVTFGWVAYASGMFAAGVAPYWIITMWMSFATTLNVSLGWMHGRPALAAATGLIAGPLTYLAGAKLGGIQLVDQSVALIALGIGWGVMMPLLLNLSRKLDGISDSPAPQASGA